MNQLICLVILLNLVQIQHSSLVFKNTLREKPLDLTLKSIQFTQPFDIQTAPDSLAIAQSKDNIPYISSEYSRTLTNSFVFSTLAAISKNNSPSKTDKTRSKRQKIDKSTLEDQILKSMDLSTSLFNDHLNKKLFEVLGKKTSQSEDKLSTQSAFTGVFIDPENNHDLAKICAFQKEDSVVLTFKAQPNPSKENTFLYFPAFTSIFSRKRSNKSTVGDSSSDFSEGQNLRIVYSFVENRDILIIGTSEILNEVYISFLTFAVNFAVQNWSESTRTIEEGFKILVQEFTKIAKNDKTSPFDKSLGVINEAPSFLENQEIFSSLSDIDVDCKKCTNEELQAEIELNAQKASLEKNLQKVCCKNNDLINLEKSEEKHDNQRNLSQLKKKQDYLSNKSVLNENDQILDKNNQKDVSLENNNQINLSRKRLLGKNSNENSSKLLIDTENEKNEQETQQNNLQNDLLSSKIIKPSKINNPKLIIEEEHPLQNERSRINTHYIDLMSSQPYDSINLDDSITSEDRPKKNIYQPIADRADHVKEKRKPGFFSNLMNNLFCMKDKDFDEDDSNQGRKAIENRRKQAGNLDESVLDDEDFTKNNPHQDVFESYRSRMVKLPKSKMTDKDEFLNKPINKNNDNLLVGTKNEQSFKKRSLLKSTQKIESSKKRFLGKSENGDLDDNKSALFSSTLSKDEENMSQLCKRVCTEKDYDAAYIEKPQSVMKYLLSMFGCCAKQGDYIDRPEFQERRKKKNLKKIQDDNESVLSYEHFNEYSSKDSFLNKNFKMNKRLGKEIDFDTFYQDPIDAFEDVIAQQETDKPKELNEKKNVEDLVKSWTECKNEDFLVLAIDSLFASDILTKCVEKILIDNFVINKSQMDYFYLKNNAEKGEQLIKFLISEFKMSKGYKKPSDASSVDGSNANNVKYYDANPLIWTLVVEKSDTDPREREKILSKIRLEEDMKKSAFEENLTKYIKQVFNVDKRVI